MSEHFQNSKLHKYAFEGKKSKLKNVLKIENINIDLIDQDSNTPLYYACIRGNKDCVKLLLEHNANPNERCNNDETPVHAAAMNGNIKILCLLIEYGGDLRLHDNKNRTAKTCAMQQENPTIRRKMLAFIEEARMNSQLIHKVNNKQTTYKLTNLNIIPKSNNELVNPCSVGFGILYKTTDEIGVPIVLPVINEEDITHDYTGDTFNNGSFMVYESMKWKELHFVTVKRLHSHLTDCGHSDLLIEELKYFKKINHYPNIISLMGFCQCENSDSLKLMFERVQCGSLFNILHEREMTKIPKLKSICQIMLSVCDALMYLHQQNIIHCYVSSHSIILTNFHSAKLANLEYAVEKTHELTKQKKSKILDNHYINCAYNWIAPELMNESSYPNEMSDMYSFCVVLWELFNVQIPWSGLKWTEIKYELVERCNYLPVNFDKIPIPFSRIIKDGFSVPIRRMGFEEVRSALENLQISLHTDKMSKTKVNRLYKRQDISKLRNNSFSEGIASVNEAISNEMETLNSIEEFDKFSQLSSQSFIHCDAYKAEIHLTKGGLNKNTRTLSVDRKNKLKPPVGRIIGHTNGNIIGPTAPNEQTLPSTPTPIKLKQQIKTKQTILNQQLPPTPPPLPPPLPLPTPSNKLISTPTNNSIQQPSFLITPSSPTPSINTTNKTTLRVSKSVESPNRIKHETSTPTKNELFDKFKQNQDKFSYVNVNKINLTNSDKFKLLEYIYYTNLINEDNKKKLFNAIKKENDLIKIRKLFNQQHHEQHHQQQQQQQVNLNKEQNNTVYNNNQNETEIKIERENPFRIHKFDEFKNNLVNPTPDDKRRYFASKNQQQIIGIDSTDYNNSKDPSQRLNYSNVSVEDNTIDKIQSQINKSQLNEKTQNIYINQELAQQTQQTQQTQQPKPNLNNVKNNKQILIEELNQKLEKRQSTSTETTGSNLTSTTTTTTASMYNYNYFQRSGSYNHLTDELRSNLTMRQNEPIINKTNTNNNNNKSQIKTQYTRSLSNNPIPIKTKSSSFTNNPLNLEHQSRRSSQIINQQQPRIGSSSLNSTKLGQCEFFGGHGSVKSLVQSYEENSAKEKNELNTKIERIRNERLKELFNAVEKGRTNTCDDKNITEQASAIELVNKAQYQIQKELSTISERTEHSSSFNNLNRNNLTSESPVNTNLITTSKATSITKSIRHLNQQNFLDSSTGASGDCLSVNKNLSAIVNLSSTPIQINNLNNTSAATISSKTSNHNLKQKTKHDSIEQSDNCLNTIKAIEILKETRSKSGQHNNQYKYDKIYKYSSELNKSDDDEQEEEEDDDEDVQEDEEEEEREELIEIGPIKEKSLNKSSLCNNEASQNRTKSYYSSQEDFLSSIHPGETSIECSENVYLNDFDKLEKELNKKYSNYFTNMLVKSNYPVAPIPFNDNEEKKKKDLLNQQGPSTSKLIINTPSESSSSIAAAYSLPSLSENESIQSINKNDNNNQEPIVEMNKVSKLGNVRMDKHVIDTSKFKGYQYKLETRSNVSNQYHIKGLLTNEQTGHQLLVTNTKVQTPNILTRVIIDQ